MSLRTFVENIFAFLCCSLVIGATASSLGLFLLYRPRDVTNDCVISHHLRFDISFGMGMSDTISMILRTQAELNYQCSIEIATERDMYMLVVVRFPNSVGMNCELNRNAISVYNSAESCESICHIIGNRNIMSPYFLLTVKSQVKLHFLSNSSINAELNATTYQISATSARKAPVRGCSPDNETTCNTMDDSFCFTSFVLCDGIKNCGVQDWFDERKSDCGLPVHKLDYPPVIAVVAAVFCALMVAGHCMARCLPPLANSFFIFNTNEDNRLRIDPILIPPGESPVEEVVLKRMSLIPSTDLIREIIVHVLEPGDTLIFLIVYLMPVCKFFMTKPLYKKVTFSSSNSDEDDENTEDQANVSGDNVPPKVKYRLPGEPGSTDQLFPFVLPAPETVLNRISYESLHLLKCEEIL